MPRFGPTSTPAAPSRPTATVGGGAAAGPAGRGDDRALAADERRERERDLVLLDPDVFGLARNVAEARILDEEPARLGGLEGDRRLGRGLHAEHLAHARASGE